MNWVSPIKDDETLEKFKLLLRNIDIKYYIMFEIGIGTGLQLQDILQLKNKDIMNKDYLTVVIGAKNVERVYHFPAEFLKITTTFLSDKDPDGYLITGFQNSKQPLSREQVYRVLKSVGKTMGISSIGAQTMRKTFAWRYYKDTGDIYYLQNLLNHATPSITYRYIGERPNVQVVLRKLSPEENERSRCLLYLNDNGRNRLNAIINELRTIVERFDDPSSTDSFYGKVDCLLDELDELMKNFKNTK